MVCWFLEMDHWLWGSSVVLPTTISSKKTVFSFSLFRGFFLPFCTSASPQCCTIPCHPSWRSTRDRQSLPWSEQKLDLSPGLLHGSPVTYHWATPQFKIEVFTALNSYQYLEHWSHQELIDWLNNAFSYIILHRGFSLFYLSKYHTHIFFVTASSHC